MGSRQEGRGGAALQQAIFGSLREAAESMRLDCKAAQTICILANKGLDFFGTDESVISAAEAGEYANLRKLRIILLSEDSRWMHEGYTQLRAYESLETFCKELRACHEVVESSMKSMCQRLRGTKSGVRYHRGEPLFRLVLTDAVAYASSYAEPASSQVSELPVFRFRNEPGSLYGAFKRLFDDLWHNASSPGTYQLENIDFETSAGGIVIAGSNGRPYIALLRRHDGYWVLPKGHRTQSDSSTEEAALREISEETGLRHEDLRVIRHLGCYGFDETAETHNSKKLVHIYLVRYAGEGLPKLTAADHAEARWWDAEGPFPGMLYTYQKSFLHEALETIRTVSHT